MKWYILIKKYPGSPEIGTVEDSHKLPGHQWPEYWREMNYEEVELRRELEEVTDRINFITEKLKLYENQ